MKNIRIMIALAVILVIVLVAQGAGAWSTKLQAGEAAPAASNVGARPLGTGGGGSKEEVPPPAGGGETCQAIAGYCVTNEEGGLVVEAITELPEGVTPPGDVVVTRIATISGTDETLGNPVFFTLDPPLKDGESVGYWDGKNWVELKGANGVYTIPAGVTLPVTLAVFTK